MVRLSKIYTKFGDAGSTMLGDGSTVPKTSARVEAYGEVDEANAAIGLAVNAIPADGEPGRTISAELRAIQNDLFDVGADLCVPLDEKAEKERPRLRVTPAQVTRLERLIDKHNEPLAPLNSFVLPGGSAASAHLHLARTIVRRAERRVMALIEREPAKVNPQALIYLNRLSDLLFVLARVMNAHGASGASGGSGGGGGGGGDVLWVPGGGGGGSGGGGD